MPSLYETYYDHLPRTFPDYERICTIGMEAVRGFSLSRSITDPRKEVSVSLFRTKQYLEAVELMNPVVEALEKSIELPADEKLEYTSITFDSKVIEPGEAYIAGAQPFHNDVEATNSIFVRLDDADPTEHLVGSLSDNLIQTLFERVSARTPVTENDLKEAIFNSIELQDDKFFKGLIKKHKFTITQPKPGDAYRIRSYHTHRSLTNNTKKPRIRNSFIAYYRIVART